MPSKPFEPVAATLRDGTKVLIRPITSDDKALLLGGFERLSEQSRYRRFLTPMPKLTDAQLRYLTEVDHDSHDAIVAIDADRPWDGYGVARYVRLDGEPEVAEAAVTVIDEYQGRGLGTLLLVLLARAAIDRGIRRFRAYVLAENKPMRDLLESLGADVHHDSPGLLRMDTPLPMDPSAVVEGPAGEILRAVARGEVPEVATERRTGEIEIVRPDSPA
ncbi:MAG: GNAT family N-acetyltransferase [Actinobacteria bacterium]|nr:GNAT family N-acetyltransferase [Actinomycetota bacterium]